MLKQEQGDNGHCPRVIGNGQKQFERWCGNKNEAQNVDKKLPSGTGGRVRPHLSAK